MTLLYPCAAKEYGCHKPDNHLLKGKFLQHKWNQCVDHLIYILTRRAIPYFIARHCWQAFGFDGANLEAQHWTEVEKSAKEIPQSDIKDIDTINFHVCLCHSALV